MNTVGLMEAAQALADHFGERVDADREDGRQMMADALRDRFAISEHTAKELVAALERGHAIRWIEGRIGALPSAYSNTPTEAPYTNTSPTGTEQPGIPLQEGYWQL